MATEKVNVTDYKELYAQYNWFSQAYPQLVQEACDEFFLPGFKFILLGISKNINSLMDKDAYFVTKVMIDKAHDMFFRSSEKTIGLILEKILGKSEGRFNLNRLTDLEAKIITAFNDHMYNYVAKLLQPAPPTLKRSNFDVIHLTFLIKDIEKGTTGKFIVTLPEVLLKPEIVVSSGDKFDYSDFASTILNVSIRVGTTRLKLIDVKNIDVDDIVVFDNSDKEHMVLKLEDYEREINLNPNLGLVLPYDNDDEGEDDMAESTNLWDSIEVEMSAQFDTVKITLGELKSIEEGLVVDLTSIYDNKVTLSVENRPVARGELVIVNDRYGVKIDEVIAKAPKASQPQQQSNDSFDNFAQDDYVDNGTQEYSEQDYEQSQGEGQTSEEDEFDYSDFELEDEDI